MSSINLIDLINNSQLYSCDLLDLQYLSSKFKKIKKKLSLKKKITIKISSDYTTSFLAEMLPIFLSNRKIDANILESEFGSLRYYIRDLNNKFWYSKGDVLILFPSSRKLSFFPKIFDNAKIIKANAKKEANIWLRAWNSTKKNIIQTTFDPLPFSNFGNADGVKFGGLLHYVRLVNSILIEKCPTNVDLIDIENLVFKNQNLKWNDNKVYNLTKQPFSMNLVPILSNIISNIISGLYGMSKKVVVLDLDNTIWGGVIGDDGIKKIKLGDETSEGEAFSNFQKYLKALSQKGIILCVCSKNDQKLAMEVFLKHKDMYLKKKDISVFVANFNDKASNIKKIGKTLNLGLDSFVFIDDSNVECELIKKIIPEIMVINLSNYDPSDFVDIVESTAPFYFKKITKEDIHRTESYKNIAILNTKVKETSNIEKFLKDLRPQISINKVNNESSERSSQLIGKTNQFKFNSKIYSPKQLLTNEILSSSVTFKDKFHNYGIIGVFVLNISKNKSIIIENWVLSCRVFSRRIENYILDYIIKKTKDLRFNNIKFKFEITKKNVYLQNFIESIGLKLKKSGNYSINIKKIKNNKKNYMAAFN